ncbi:uncharacterized protein LOC6582566 [Drosophila mojavensis]|uniref:CCC domain-containing protein n=1 Tax=Drosophila mojavensis TaxID=7230 RepID=B4KY41_DROMO|nr:uncharacterized protein LOC6582566 [Drosophila mojavensis]EDW18743.1 uncharacterized protein Dmoj_GI13396 [Drosophila mojavensis]
MRKSAEDSVDCMISSNTSDKRSSCHTTPNGLPIVPKATFLSLCLLLMFSRCSSLDELGNKASGISESYEELKFDHEVSEQDAEQALRKLNATRAGIQNSCNSMDCGQYLDYCWTPQFEKDHCWCELQHREEGLPYKAHKCFVEEKIYKPSVGSCYFFEEVKECCCVSAFLREWRRISSAPLSRAQPVLSCLLAILSLLHWHSRRH